jgi:hypothetical protein
MCQTLTPQQDFDPFGCQQPPQTTQASGHVFTYTLEVGANSDVEQWVSSPKTTCRQLTLQFTTLQHYGQTTTLQLVQATLDAVSATAADGQLGTLTANLDGGPWQLKTQASIEVGGSYNVYLDGSASCYTPTGF